MSIFGEIASHAVTMKRVDKDVTALSSTIVCPTKPVPTKRDTRSMFLFTTVRISCAAGYIPIAISFSGSEIISGT